MKWTQMTATHSSNIKGSSTDAVHQLGEGAGGVPAAPLFVQLRQRREEVLEGAYAPRSRPGAAAILDGPAARSRGVGVWWGPVTCRAGTGVTVSQEPLPLLRDTECINVLIQTTNPNPDCELCSAASEEYTESCLKNERKMCVFITTKQRGAGNNKCVPNKLPLNKVKRQEWLERINKLISHEDDHTM